MGTIIYECDVTEFDIIPRKENNENAFALNQNSLIINLLDGTKDKILVQTEISKEDAINLAKLILLKYERT